MIQSINLGEVKMDTDLKFSLMSTIATLALIVIMGLISAMN